MKMLRLLFWESTIRCNLNCAHCRRVEDDTTAPQDLTTDQARDMITSTGRPGTIATHAPDLGFFLAVNPSVGRISLT